MDLITFPDLIDRYGSLRNLGVAYTQARLTYEEERLVETYCSPERLLAWQVAALALQLQRGLGHTTESRPLPEDHV